MKNFRQFDWVYIRSKKEFGLIVGLVESKNPPFDCFEPYNYTVFIDPTSSKYGDRTNVTVTADDIVLVKPFNSEIKQKPPIAGDSVLWRKSYNSFYYGKVIREHTTLRNYVSGFNRAHVFKTINTTEFDVDVYYSNKDIKREVISINNILVLPISYDRHKKRRLIDILR